MRNKRELTSPVINTVIYLNKRMIYYGHRLPHGRKRKTVTGDTIANVDIKRCYLYPLLEKTNTLFTYVFRTLRGKDYNKRSIELIEEIQATCYLIMELDGWNNAVCAELDQICDDIISQLNKIKFSTDVIQSH